MKNRGGARCHSGGGWHASCTQEWWVRLVLHSPTENSWSVLIYCFSFLSLVSSFFWSFFPVFAFIASTYHILHIFVRLVNLTLNYSDFHCHPQNKHTFSTIHTYITERQQLKNVDNDILKRTAECKLLNHLRFRLTNNRILIWKFQTKEKWRKEG